MKIKGLDYNTQREQLVLPEYGREVQSMVDYCMDLKDRQERQRCAESIVAIMERMKPRVGDAKEYRHKLWDHLALMSGFRLDIDYPFDISQAHHMMEKPKPMAYPMKRIPVRHYGNMMFEIFDKLTSPRSSLTVRRCRSRATTRRNNAEEKTNISLWNRLSLKEDIRSREPLRRRERRTRRWR